MIKMRRKKKLLIANILIISFILFGRVFIILWESVFADIVPYKKTAFKDYNDFYQQSIKNFFPSELPESATNIQYYYYSGMQDEKFGVSFVVNGEDYEDMQEYYLSYYYPLIDSKAIKYFSEQQLTDEFVRLERLDFIENIIAEENEKYTFLLYQQSSSEHYQIKSGVLYNDETNEVVIIFYDDQLFMEKE